MIRLCEGDEASIQAEEVLGFRQEEGTEQDSDRATGSRFAAGIGYGDVVKDHLRECSAAFPQATLLVEYRSEKYCYAGRMVFHAGRIAVYLSDDLRLAAGFDWTLLDVFAPFRVEGSAGLEFGSLWGRWVEDMRSDLEILRRVAPSSGRRA
jgi:hypothetical protein